MIVKRVAAWMILAAVLWGAVALYRHFSNPWKGGLVPVAELLPKLPNGCAKNPDCKP